MEMTGEHRIAAPRSVVWEGLNDPEVLRRSIPGCDTLEKTSPTEMTATVTAKVGPVKASFGGQVTLSNLNPPESYTISGEGKGGAAGFAKGGADVKLVEDGDGTRLHYAVKANIGGKLAQLGARLIDGTAKKMADDFFTRFAAEMEQRAARGRRCPRTDSGGRARGARAGCGRDPGADSGPGRDGGDAAEPGRGAAASPPPSRFPRPSRCPRPGRRRSCAGAEPTLAAPPRRPPPAADRAPRRPEPGGLDHRPGRDRAGAAVPVFVTAFVAQAEPVLRPA